jgi:hypothetical protein
MMVFRSKWITQSLDANKLLKKPPFLLAPRAFKPCAVGNPNTIATPCLIINTMIITTH